MQPTSGESGRFQPIIKSCNLRNPGNVELTNMEELIMNPSKVRRDRLNRLTDLPNIGPSIAKRLNRIGVNDPADLVGRDPYKMFAHLCEATGAHEDPCVLDVFISITRFMDGDSPKPWWAYTSERKMKLETLQQKVG